MAASDLAAVVAEKESQNCSLCGLEAIARFHLPGGCIAFPEMTEQDLCLHHAVRSQPNDGMELVVDYSRLGMFGHWWNNGQKFDELPKVKT